MAPKGKKRSAPADANPRDAKRVKLADSPGSKIRRSRAEHQRWRKDRQRKIRRKVERSVRISINAPSCTRTLRTSTRNHMYEEADKSLRRIPGIENLNYRYQHRVYPSGHFLSLPTEIREKILDYTINSVEMRLMQVSELVSLVGKYSTICPRIRMDMAYIAKRWYEEKDGHVQRLRKSDPERAEIARYWIAPQRKKKEVHIVVKKKKDRNYRAPRCWQCMQRHYPKDLICTLQRQNPKEWVRVTKPLSEYKRVKMGIDGVQKMDSFQGKKTIFNEDEMEEQGMEM